MGEISPNLVTLVLMMNSLPQRCLFKNQYLFDSKMKNGFWRKAKVVLKSQSPSPASH